MTGSLLPHVKPEAELIVLGWDETPQCDCVSTLSTLLIILTLTDAPSPSIKRCWRAASWTAACCCHSVWKNKWKLGVKAAELKRNRWTSSRGSVSERGSLRDTDYVLVHFHSASVSFSSRCRKSKQSLYLYFPEDRTIISITQQESNLR